jgi:hypothetical protein
LTLLLTLRHLLDAITPLRHDITPDITPHYAIAITPHIERHYYIDNYY